MSFNSFERSVLKMLCNPCFCSWADKLLNLRADDCKVSETKLTHGFAAPPGCPCLSFNSSANEVSPGPINELLKSRTVLIVSSIDDDPPCRRSNILDNSSNDSFNCCICFLVVSPVLKAIFESNCTRRF